MSDTRDYARIYAKLKAARVTVLVTRIEHLLKLGNSEREFVSFFFLFLIRLQMLQLLGGLFELEYVCCVYSGQINA